MSIKADEHMLSPTGYMRAQYTKGEIFVVLNERTYYSFSAARGYCFMSPEEARTLIDALTPLAADAPSVADLV